MRILVTGGTGFIGHALLDRLVNDGHIVSAAIRDPDAVMQDRITKILIGDIGSNTNWSNWLDGIDAVIHLAARVHVMKDTAANPLAEFRRTNTEGTLNLARAATHAGVKKFIFLSTIKVNGELTMPGCAFHADDVPAPVDPYGRSKLEAETELLLIGLNNGMAITIVRPTMVYGPGVKGNFLSLMNLIDKRIPLPFGSIENKRSMIGLSNLVDLISKCLVSPAAANQVFLASDGVDISTTELLRGIGWALGKPPLLVPIPAVAVTTIGSLIGMRALVVRLCGNLQVDIEKNQRVLEWWPSVTMATELRQTAMYFYKTRNKLFHDPLF